MMNIKKINLIVTALGSLMVMGTMLSPMAASATTKVESGLIAINSTNSEKINISLDDMNTEFVSISDGSLEDMLKVFDVKPSAEDKKQMQKYFDKASKLAKDGKFEEAEKIWEKFDKILEKYVDFFDISDASIISIDDIELEPSAVSQSTIGEARILSDEEINNLMAELEKSFK